MLQGEGTYFENDELVQLTRVLDAACAQLSIARDADAQVREKIAQFIMQIACRGERDPEQIQNNVLVLHRR